MLIGQYVIESEIGRGGFAVVYKAREITGHGRVALKKCFRTSSATTFDDMKAEYELIKLLEHKNIVRVLDFIQEGDGLAAIAMELADKSLKDLLKINNFRLYEALVRDYAFGALRGLAFLHYKNVVHCDIKPGNIVLNGPTVKLCDFGLSKSIDGQQADALRGTVLYMAPELLTHREHTRASDIWALGCTLVEVACGKNPWAGKVIPDANNSHSVAAAQPSAIAFRLNYLFSSDAFDPESVVPNHLTKQLRELLCSMLQRDPSKRPTAARCLCSPYFLDGDEWTEKGLEHKVESSLVRRSPK